MLLSFHLISVNWLNTDKMVIIYMYFWKGALLLSYQILRHFSLWNSAANNKELNSSARKEVGFRVLTPNHILHICVCTPKVNFCTAISFHLTPFVFKLKKDYGVMSFKYPCIVKSLCQWSPGSSFIGCSGSYGMLFLAQYVLCQVCNCLAWFYDKHASSPPTPCLFRTAMNV